MTYYTKKPDAIAEANRLAEDPRVAYTKVEMVAYNGFVVVVVPRIMDCSDLYDTCEVRSPAGHRVSPVPANKRKMPTNISKPRATRAPSTPVGPYVAAPPPPPPPAAAPPPPAPAPAPSPKPATPAAFVAAPPPPGA